LSRHEDYEPESKDIHKKRSVMNQNLEVCYSSN